MRSMYFLGVQGPERMTPSGGALFVCKAVLPLRHFDRFAKMSSMHFFGVQKFAFGPFWESFFGPSKHDPTWT